MQKISKTTGLTRKQKAFADKLIANPKMSATESAHQTYNGTRQSAEVIASENLRKPPIIKYLNEHVDKAEMVILDVMSNSSQMKDEPAHAKIALDASNSVLDRVLGKATQRVESAQTVVTLSLDLTQLDKP
jgi:phage terminase small subunit